jgi:hypothetical protein
LIIILLFRVLAVTCIIENVLGYALSQVIKRCLVTRFVRERGGGGRRVVGIGSG